MYRLFSDKMMSILKSLSCMPKSRDQISGELFSRLAQNWSVEMAAASLTPEIGILVRWDLIQWARQKGDRQRYYHITVRGRRFLRDYCLIESFGLFERFPGGVSFSEIWNSLDQRKRKQYASSRLALINNMIDKLRKSQATLKNEPARALLLHYNLHHLIGELKWLQEVSGLRGTTNE